MLAITSHAALEGSGLPAPSPGHAHELVVWCEDIDAAMARLRAAGAPVLVEPYAHVAGHRRAYVADPDANWLALVQE
jgi:lactoylglutathione lyase